MRRASLSSVLCIGAAVAALAGCRGGIGGAPTAPVPDQPSLQSVAATLPSPTPWPVTEGVGSGSTHVGSDDLFSPTDGDSPSGGHGPAGSTLSGIRCDTSMSNSGYHIHFFLGIAVNGRQYALPDGAGIADPGGEITYNGIPNQTEYTRAGSAGCFYRLHTHDWTGVVHVELPDPNHLLSVKSSQVKLGQFLAIWGHKVSTTSFDTLGGPVKVVTSGQRYQGGIPSGEVYSSSYSYYTGDPNLIPVYSHEVIWLLVGSGNPTPQKLPNIVYYQEY